MVIYRSESQILLKQVRPSKSNNNQGFWVFFFKMALGHLNVTRKTMILAHP